MVICVSDNLSLESTSFQVWLKNYPALLPSAQFLEASIPICTAHRTENTISLSLFFIDLGSSFVKTQSSHSWLLLSLSIPGWTGAGEMFQRVKYLLCKYKNWVQILIPLLAGMGKGCLWGLTTKHLVPGSVGEPNLKAKVDSGRGRP